MNPDPRCRYQRYRSTNRVGPLAPDPADPRPIFISGACSGAYSVRILESNVNDPEAPKITETHWNNSTKNLPEKVNQVSNVK